IRTDEDLTGFSLLAIPQRIWWGRCGNDCREIQSQGGILMRYSKAAVARILCLILLVQASVAHAQEKGEARKNRIAILTRADLDTSGELLHVDRQLTDLLARQLREQSAVRGEKLVVVSAHTVEEFEKRNPSWGEMDRDAIGKELGADWLIGLK